MFVCVYKVLLFLPKLCSVSPQSDKQTGESKIHRNTHTKGVGSNVHLTWKKRREEKKLMVKYYFSLFKHINTITVNLTSSYIQLQQVKVSHWKHS